MDFVSAEGCELVLADGKRVLDLYGGHCVNTLGAGDTALGDELSAQWQSLSFATNLIDQRRQDKEETVPIGLIQSAIGGSQIEAWTPDSALGKCKNGSLNDNGQAPPGRLFNGMVAPFVNISLTGFLWCAYSCTSASPRLRLLSSVFPLAIALQLTLHPCGL